MSTCIRGCTSVRNYDDGTTARIPVQTEPPSQLCEPDTKRLLRWLEDIPVTYALLPYVIEPGSVEKDPDGIASKRVHAPIPLRVEIVDLTDQRRDGRGDEARGVLGILEGWARIVREERHLAVNGTATILTEINLLTAHLNWVTTRPWVDEMYEEIRAITRDLTTAIGDYRAHPVGRCPVTDEHGECAGPLMPTPTGAVNCVKCQAHWDGGELRRLGLIMNG